MHPGDDAAISLEYCNGANGLLYHEFEIDVFYSDTLMFVQVQHDKE
jgi:hypothetical protein